MSEEPKSLSLGTILVLNEVQCDPWPSSLSRDLSPPNVSLVPFVIMCNKENNYITNLSPSVDGSSWILAICSLRIMKTSLGMGTYLLSKFDSRSPCGSDILFICLCCISLLILLSLLHLSLLLLCHIWL